MERCSTLAERINEGLRRAENRLDRADELAAERLGSGGIVSRRLDRAAGRCAGQIAAAMEDTGDGGEDDRFMDDPFDLSPGDRAWASWKPGRFNV